MSSPTAAYRYRVSDRPEDPESFRNVPFQRHNPRDTENFNVNLCVRIEVRSQIVNIPSLLSSHYLSCKQFFQGGPAFLRGNLSHQLLPSEALDVMIPRIMSDAKRLFQNHPRCHSHVGDLFIVYPLAVDIIVGLPDAEEVVAAIERILMWESMQQVRMVPASQEAIQSLNSVKLQEYVSDGTNHNQCCICLEDFHEEIQVSAMPCHHIYHNDCIVHWLKTSHLCPLCRYPMPVPNTM